MLYEFVITPKSYQPFESEEAQIEKCKEWGLLSEKAAKTKRFIYKGNGMSLPCGIVGFADKITAVIEFENNQQHCIHPSFLKEMQASGYSQKVTPSASEAAEEQAEAKGAVEEVPLPPEAPVAEADKPAEPPKAKGKKEKTPKLELPEGKVRMIATVKEFTTVPNHFSDSNDEVVIYEGVSILEPEAELDTAWSSHSATLKKMELQVGDTITFEAKVAAKKLTKHPVPYKINNPSKLQKEEA
ncbi:hypothetical protein [Paenibacillus sp. y28]|uniref:hypothetical protein n=1 Tax=Paenibacillus sp. y28 TaxID=3129110 RepID=UPI00301724E1